MITTGENRSTRKITSPSGTSSTTYLIYTGLGFNTSHRGVRPLTNPLSYSMEKLIQYNALYIYIYIYICKFLPQEEHS